MQDMKLYILSAPGHIIMTNIIANDNNNKQEKKTKRKYTKRLIVREEDYSCFLYSLSFSVVSKFSISMCCFYTQRGKYSKRDSKTNTATKKCPWA